MRGSRATLLILFMSSLLAGCVETPEPEATITDAFGHTVDVSDTRRLVVTSVDLVEVLVELGHADRIVGLPSWIESEVSCVTPPDGTPDSAARIGKPHVINAEQVVALDPSLVLVKDHPLQPTPLADQLRAAGVPVFEFDSAETLASVVETYEAVGRVLEGADPAAPVKASQAATEFQNAVGAVIANLPKAAGTAPRMVYQFPAGLVGGSGTSAHLTLIMAGGSNIAADAGLEGYKQLSNEALAQADPQRVVTTCTTAATADGLYGAPKWSGTAARDLAPESLLVTDPSLTALVGPRWPQGLERVAQWVHPDAFGFITPEIQTRGAAGAVHVDAANSTATDGLETLRVRFDDGQVQVHANATLQWSHPVADACPIILDIQLLDKNGRVYHETPPRQESEALCTEAQQP